MRMYLIPFISAVALLRPSHCQTTSNSIAGGLATILLADTTAIPAECQKIPPTIIEPLFTDPECQLNQLISGTVSPLNSMSQQLNKICSNTCTEKGQKAVIAISQVPVCADHPIYGVALVGAFYNWNQLCLKSEADDYCVFEQGQSLQQSNLPLDAPLDKWPKDLLCTKCAQKQYQMFKYFKSPQLFTRFSQRVLPGTNEALLKSVCGDQFVLEADNVDYSFAVNIKQQQQHSASASKRHVVQRSHLILLATVILLLYSLFV